MNQEITYSQFIHGKLEKQTNYQIVAHTPDLKEHDKLNRIKSTCGSFFAEPKDNNSKSFAMGVFCQEGYLILVQSKLAFNEVEESLVTDPYYRPITQSRYILIPINIVIENLEGRTFKLLSWIAKQPIPILKDFNPELEHIKISPLEENISNQQEKEIEKIEQCLTEKDSQGRYWLILAIAALLNGKRLIIDFVSSSDNAQKAVSPVIYLESILLLLPAKLRSYISVVMGSISEIHCKWAEIIIDNKYNGNYYALFSDDIIRFNRSSGELIGQLDDTTFNNEFVNDILSEIIKYEDRIPSLIKKLDKITDDVGTLKEPNYIAIVVRLIPILPNNLQEQIWRKWLSKIKTKNEWEYINKLTDDELGYQIAFRVLIENNKHNIHEYIDTIFSLLKFFSERNNVWLFTEYLPNNIEVAKILLDFDLLEESNINLAPSEVRCQICNKVVESISISDTIEATKFAIKLSKNIVFEDKSHRFILLDIALSGKKVSQEYLYDYINSHMILLMAHIDNNIVDKINLLKCIENSHLKTLVNKIITKHHPVLNILPEIASLTGMNEKQKDNFYISFLSRCNVSYQESRELLVAHLHYFPILSNNSSLSTIAKTCQYFEKQNIEFKNIFYSLEQKPECWDTWLKLSHTLHDNQLECVEFLDKEVGNKFCIEVLEQYFPLISTNEHLITRFCQTSRAWKSLEAENLSQLIENLKNHIAIIIRCLANSGRFSWIKGNSLHYLSESWITAKKIDEDLKTLVTSPEVIKEFNIEEWFILHKVNWKLGFQLNLYNKKLLKPEQTDSCVNLAIQVTKEYTQPEQTDRLLQDCDSWGINLTQQKKILKLVSDQARNFEIVFKYISKNIQDINLEQDIPLLFSQLERLSSDNLIQVLQGHFSQNLPLAELLFNHGLYNQNCFKTKTNVIPEVRALCQKVIEYKCRNNWAESWELVKRFTQSEIYQKDDARFHLIQAIYPNQTLQDTKLLLEYCNTIVKFYRKREQVQNLLKDCKNWGLSITEQKNIIKATFPEAISVQLILPYLYNEDGQLITIEQDIVELFLGIEITNEEKVDMKKYLIDLLSQHIFSAWNLKTLDWCKDKIIDKDIYYEAFSKALQGLLPQVTIKELHNHFLKLKEYSTNSFQEECEIIRNEINSKFK